MPEPEQMKEATHTLTPTPRRGLVGWALYDWANSPFTTLIITFVFAAYFSRGIVATKSKVRRCGGMWLV